MDCLVEARKERNFILNIMDCMDTYTFHLGIYISHFRRALLGVINSTPDELSTGVFLPY